MKNAGRAFALNLAVISMAAAQGAVTITGCPSGTAMLSQTYSWAGTVTDGLPPYTWSVVGALPPGLSLAPSGTISGTPTQPGTFPFTLAVNALSGAEATRACQIIVGAPLSITTLNLAAGVRSVPYSETLSLLGGTPPYTWSITSGSLPSGLQLTSAGVIVGTPTQDGSFPFMVRVQDAGSSQTVSSVTLAISEGIIIPECVEPQAEVGLAYSSTFVAVGGRAPYSWAVDGTLPQGLQLNRANGRVAGTPSQPGSETFTIRVTDKDEATSSRSCTIQVLPELRILTSSLPQASQGAGYSAQIEVTGGAPPYSFSVRNGALPSGLSLTPSTGQITGRVNQPGSSTFTIRVTDALTRSVDRALTISVGADISITACPAALAILNENYTSTLTASNAQAPTQWTIRTGTLPTGLSLNAGNGQITGTARAVGLFAFEVQVSDAAQRSATRNCTIRVEGPTLSILSPPLLPTATVGQSYSQTLEATGGRAPYQWTLISGSLPPGISLSTAGVLSGTPSRAGATTFVIRARDQDGVQASQDFSLDVRAASTPAISLLNLPQTAAPAQQVEVNVALAQVSPVTTRGLISVAFIPDSDLRVDDPSIQFSTGGRSVAFSIPATQVRASGPPVLLQTGTVAGLIRLDVAIEGDSTPVTVFSQNLRLDRRAPTVTAATVVRTSIGLELQVSGYATNRQVTQGTFRFFPDAGASFNAFDVVVPLSEPAASWFASTTSAQYGSQFQLVQPLQVQGDPSVFSSIQVTLTNTIGSSTTVSAAVP